MARFLVVGGAGYIGSHVVKRLLEQGFQVVSLDNLSTGHRQAVVGGELIVGDLGDPRLLDQVLGAAPVDCVMHFAALCLVGESVEHPVDYYRTNVCRTAALLDAMVRHGVGRLIFSSTAAVYGEPRQIPIREDDPTEPSNPYGRTKLAAEQLLADCDRAHGLRSVCLRYFNAAGADPAGAIGEDHRPETHLIPIVLQAALGMRPRVEVYGTDWDTPDGTCIRDYVHVQDLADAHVLAARHLLDGGASATYNLGCAQGLSVRQALDLARQVTGREIPVAESPRRRGDPARLVASSERIRGELGWRPRFEDPREIIETAWAWHSSHPQGYGSP